MYSLNGDGIHAVKTIIGRNAIILKGVTIGNNVIIGAGAVVTKDCDSNSVYAGVPALKFVR